MEFTMSFHQLVEEIEKMDFKDPNCNKTDEYRALRSYIELI